MTLDVMRGIRSLFLGLALTGCLATQALAAPAIAWVTSTADSGPGSLRQVIADAAPDTHVLLGPELAYRTITLSSELIVDKNLTIDGTGAPGVAISGNDAVRVFNIGNDGATCGVMVTLKALRIVRGNLPLGVFGAGVWTCAATLTIESVSFDDNYAAQAGGGLYQTAGVVTIYDSAFVGNYSTQGAALVSTGGPISLERVTVAGNSGSNILVFDNGGTATLSNVTVSGNATLLGPTLYVWTGTVATMRSSTIAGNTQFQGLGFSATLRASGTLEVGNSIVANAQNCDGPGVVSLGNNLEFGAVGTCGFPSADPQLGTLGLYGSSRVATLPIAATSPARDAANNATCPAEDGSGKPRAVGVGNACDIGAFEYDGPLTATVTNLNDSGAGSLRQAISDIGSGGTIAFQHLLSGVIAIDTPLVALRSVTIQGPGLDTLAIERNTAAGQFRLLETGSPGPACPNLVMTISGLTLRGGDGNGAPGGAILNCASLTVDATRFTGNNGLGGSAIHAFGGTLIVKLSRFDENLLTPAIGVGPDVEAVTVTDSSFIGMNDGLAFGANSGAVLLRNVTINSSGAPIQGAADRMALEHVTVVADVPLMVGAPVSIANSILSGGTSLICNGPAFESRGHNVFSGPCPALSADPSNIAGNPLLGPVALHAPGIVLTRGLGVGSPAIDLGDPANCPAIDARGIARPQGAGCDAGAFEAHIITLAPASLPPAFAGAPLTIHFTHTGGFGAVTFTMPPDQLPPGLTLAPDGVLSGAPTTSGIFNFVLTATDATGVGVATSYALTVDAPPTVTFLLDREITRNSALGPLTFTIGDGLTAPGALTVTASSNNQALVPDANIVLGGSGAARTVTVTPLPGASGQAVITIAVSDGTFTTFMAFNVTVMPVYYLAEGATGPFFDLDLLIANPNSTNAHADIVFLLSDGTTVSYPKTIAPMTRVTIAVDEIPGLESAAVSSVVTSTFGLPLVVERTMRWDATGYGSHTEAATQGAAPVWYFAEGAQGFFSTFILLANPDAQATTAQVTYFREGATSLTRDYPVPALSRVTIDASADPELVDRSFGARVTFDRPGIAERAMYFNGSGGTASFFTGGHASAGVTSPSTSWFLAEGATGSYFTTFLLLANPQTTDTTATLTYLPASGMPVTRTVDVPALGRATVNIALEDASLADAAVATRVESLLPIVVERSQYWPSPVWHEAHNSFGATAAATRWGLAEGRVGGASAWQTYILLANPGTDAAEATITFLRENGTPLTKTFAVPATSRVNVALTGADSIVPELVDESFGAIIDATGPIVVERSLYNNANGVVWAAGTNAVATRLP